MLETYRQWTVAPIVFTNGCFDILHSGHASLLNESRDLGEALIVGLNSDESVRLLKGQDRPVNNQDDRAYLLSSMYAVDHVIIFDEYSVLDLIKFIKPDIITKGGDYTPEQLANDGGDFMKEIGGELVIIPITRQTSTTTIIDKIKD
jgi:D-beta-D-heptose 7-phosphate kinase/D-beta-D-heptose 1-phosphate adenosyltransferase